MKQPRKSTPSSAPKPPAKKSFPLSAVSGQLLLAGIWALAFALRCFYIWQIHRAPFYDLRLGDAEAYDQWARAIAAGDWLGKDVFYQAPLYPYFLALIYRLLDDSVTTVRIVQALLGSLSCVLLARAGISFIGRWGAAAGVLLAIYPPAIFLDESLEKSALATFLMTALLAIVADGFQPAQASGASSRRHLAAGIVLGLLALTRENALILAVPIVVWTALENRRLRPALLLAAGCAAVLLPVAIRNLAVGGEFHLTTAQFGPNFYIGNHAGAKGTYEALVIGHGNASDERQDATQTAEQASGRRLSPGEVSSYWTSRALDFMRAHPGEWLALMARKLALALNASELTDTESQRVYAEWSWLLRMPFDFGLLLALAALAAVLHWEARRGLWLLYAMAAAYILSVAMFYVFGRYRFPVVPLFMLIASAGVARLKLLPHGRGSEGAQQRGRRLVIGLAAAVVAFAFSRIPLDDGRAARATTYHVIATALAKESGREYEALGFYKSALAADPKFSAAQVGLGTLLSAMDRREEALPYFRAAIVSWPDYAEARYNLALTLAAIGQDEAAAQEFEQALRLSPADADSHIAYGKVLLALNRPQEAAEHYQKGLAIRPKDVTALVGWGVALAQTGHPDEAIRKFQTALLVDPRSASAHNNLGWTLANLGRMGEAIGHFERALAIDPEYQSARRNLEQARRALSRR